MTTSDIPLLSRRHRRQQTRADSRPRVTGHDELALERQALLLSLQTVGCVALTLFLLRLGLPGPAFVFLGLGVLGLSRSHPE